MKKFKWTIFLIILIGVSCKDKSEITPKIDVELLKLTNGISKTWKLYRSGTCVSLGPDEFAPAGWWDGLSNNGETPCMFEQTFTFHLDGVFVFDDTGVFWGEHDTWRGTILQNKCFEPTAGNMVNKSGVDVSAWGSGTHSFTYDTEMGELTLTGLGAWIGGKSVV